LEDLVHNAVQELWRPTPSELSLVTSKGGAGFTILKPPPSAQTLSGSSDPCYVEAYHLTDPNERRLTLHLKVWKWVEGSLLSLMDKAGTRHGLDPESMFWPKADAALCGTASADRILLKASHWYFVLGSL
jgi:hypothetical protein